jgi:hypothetical protein
MSTPLGLILHMKWSRHRVVSMSRPLGLMLHMKWSRHRVVSTSRPSGLILNNMIIIHIYCTRNNTFRVKLYQPEITLHHLMIIIHIYCLLASNITKGVRINFPASNNLALQHCLIKLPATFHSSKITFQESTFPSS